MNTFTVKLCTALLVISFPVSSFARGYIKLGDIKGESVDTTSTTVPLRIQAAPTACTEDAKICPDGTAVGRDSNNNCEFFPCPPVVKVVPEPGALPELPPYNPCDEGFIECPDGRCVRDREECDDAAQIDPPSLQIDFGATDEENKSKGTVEATRKVEEGTALEQDPPSLQLDAGPSDTETQGGNAETTWKVEKGEKAQADDDHKDWINLDSTGGPLEPDEKDIAADEPSPAAKKPREIVVVGSKVKDETEAEKEARIEKATPKLQEKLASADQLPEYLQALVDVDENIQKVHIETEMVSMSYTQPAKLFGFLVVDYVMTTKVEVRGWDPEAKELEEDNENIGRVKVKFPWWVRLTTNSAKDIEKDMNDILQNIDDVPLQKMQQTLQTMSNVSKMYHDTGMAITRKIGG